MIEHQSLLMYPIAACRWRLDQDGAGHAPVTRENISKKTSGAKATITFTSAASDSENSLFYHASWEQVQFWIDGFHQAESFALEAEAQRPTGAIIGSIRFLPRRQSPCSGRSSVTTFEASYCQVANIIPIVSQQLHSFCCITSCAHDNSRHIRFFLFAKTDSNSLAPPPDMAQNQLNPAA
jgi:hypothetical protein